MNRRTLLVAFFVAIGVPTFADPTSVDAALTSAAPWLSMVDELEYSKSWSAASSLLQAEVSESEWITNLQNIRSRLGALGERKLKSSEFEVSMPDLPDGQYVILIYNSAFEQRQFAAEILVLAKEQDSSWRVLGYYVE